MLEQIRGVTDAVVVAAAPSGEIMFSNREGQRVRGRRLSEFAGEFEIYHLDGRPYLPSEWHLARAIATGEEIVDEEFLYVESDGSRTIRSCSCSPVYDHEGHIVAAVAVTRDVTEQSQQNDHRATPAGSRFRLPVHTERRDRAAIERLTPREREVLQALAEGLDTQAVADRLHISLRTQRNHVANILAKLGVHSQLQALVFAVRYEVVEIR